MMCKICDEGAGWGLVIIGAIFLLRDYGIFHFKAGAVASLLLLVGIAKIMCGNCATCNTQYDKK